MHIALAPSGAFTLTLPSGHHVNIPPTLTGLSILRRILTEQSIAEDQRIATPASPIQHMVDEWVKADEQRQRAEDRERLTSLNLSSIHITI